MKNPLLELFLQKNIKRQIEKKAEVKFTKALNKALNLAYLAGIKNRGDVLTLPINELWLSLVAKNK